jgi:hypothetical protein
MVTQTAGVANASLVSRVIALSDCAEGQNRTGDTWFFSRIGDALLRVRRQRGHRHQHRIVRQVSARAVIAVALAVMVGCSSRPSALNRECLADWPIYYSTATELAERADVIVRGWITASERTTEHGGPGWRSRLRVESTLKGGVRSEVIIVEQGCELVAGEIGSRWLAFLLSEPNLLGDGLAPVNGPAGLLFLEGLRVKVPHSADLEFRHRYDGRLLGDLETEILRVAP